MKHFLDAVEIVCHAALVGLHLAMVILLCRNWIAGKDADISEE